MWNKAVLVLLVGCVLAVWGCKKQSDEPSSNADDGAGYLERQKDAVVEKTSGIYSQLDTDTRQLLANIKDSGKEVWQKSSVELESKLAIAKQKFGELQDAGGDNVQKAQDAFDVAIEELKDTYSKTKAEITKEDGQ